jgi:DNA-binding response OmpR family regulator
MSVFNDPIPEPSNSGGSASENEVLAGRRILIVEDDPFIALALEETLREHGLVIVAVARKLSQALELVARETIELALLDVNIGDEKIDPVADLLAARNCPFVFTTGYGRAGLPESHASRMIIEKPFYIEEILTALRGELSDKPRES